MKVFIKVVVAFLSVITLSCNGENEPTLNTNVNDLAKSINLAVKPVAAQWTFSTTASGRGADLGPTDYTIVAVLKYSHANWLLLYKDHEAMQPIETVYQSKEILKDWYPKSVKACFKDNDGYLNINQKVYNVTAFAKDSFIHGFCFFTDNDEVYLYTYTM